MAAWQSNGWAGARLGIVGQALARKASTGVLGDRPGRAWGCYRWRRSVGPGYYVELALAECLLWCVCVCTPYVFSRICMCVNEVTGVTVCVGE